MKRKIKLLDYSETSCNIMAKKLFSEKADCYLTELSYMCGDRATAMSEEKFIGIVGKMFYDNIRRRY